MAITFYGDWFVRCDRINGDFSQRFVIRGSDSSDAEYEFPPESPGYQISRVSGEEWSIEMQWNNNAGSDWQPSDIRRSPSYTVLEGFVIRLEADDNTADVRDFDYDDMILICMSLDRTINPKPPSDYPFDFTISKEMLTEKKSDKGR